MLKIIFGHRGTGKTSLLMRLQHYAQQLQRPCYCLDLDQEIERRYQMTVSAIFQQHGESVFREYEQTTLRALIAWAQSPEHREVDIFLATGGGCELAVISELPVREVEKIWVRRHSDQTGRIFLQRPRLEQQLGPLEEYLERFQQREKNFTAWADMVITLPEGMNAPNWVEAQLLYGMPMPLKADVTLLPENFRSREYFGWLLDRYRQWEIRYFELRDDLLTAEQIALALEMIPAASLLLSVRQSESELLALITAQGKNFVGIWDLAVEVENFRSIIARVGPPTIVSKHQARNQAEAQDFNLFVAELEELQRSCDKKLWLKAAPMVDNLRQCRQGYLWQRQNPARAIFFPRSDHGRWRWFRCLLGPMPLQFIRAGGGSSLDQPTFFDWVTQNASVRNQFAAVIGQPVAHSFSPGQHFNFFQERHLPFYAIEMASEEWDEGMDFLLELGFTYGAVTAPLKLLAAQWATQLTPLAQELGAVNTLYVDGKCKMGHNTDWAGFLQLLPTNLPSYPMVIWGGGGTLAMLQKVLPNAYYYQARSGQARNPDHWLPLQSQVHLVWAAGKLAENARPEQSFALQSIIDLSYTDNSPALALAAKLQIPYYSGLPMFVAQAQEQQQFWRSHDR